MFIKTFNEESIEVYINLSNVEFIFKGHFCNKRPAIFFRRPDKQEYYWVFQSEEERDIAFGYLFNLVR